MSLRSIWCALTGNCADPALGNEARGDVCFYGMPLRAALLPGQAPLADEGGPGEEDGPWADGWEGRVRQDGRTLLCCDNPEDIIREVRTLKAGDYEINPISGIPYTDAERKEWQLDTFLFEYFPDAFLAVVQVAIAGNKQHNPGQPLHWARGKSTDQFNTAFRHYWERRRGVRRDTDKQYHLAKAIWRLMAQLQLDIEEDRK